MAKIFSVVSRAGLARVLDPVARALLRAGITPNAVTVLGTIGVCVGAIGFGARGHIFIGLVIVTLSALTDMIDGAMARARGSSGRFGALLDSTSDRIADGVIFGSVAYWFAVTGHHRASIVTTVCLVSGLVVSYVKARAEGLGFDCNVGLVERPERLIAIGFGGLLEIFDVPYGFEVVLWILAATSVYTVWQRMAHVYRRDAAEQRAAAPRDGAARREAHRRDRR